MTTNATAQVSKIAQAASEVAQDVLQQDPLNLAARREAVRDAADSVIDTAAQNAKKITATKKSTLKKYGKALAYTAGAAAVIAGGVYLYKRFAAGESIEDVAKAVADAATPAA